MKELIDGQPGPTQAQPRPAYSYTADRHVRDICLVALFIRYTP